MGIALVCAMSCSDFLEEHPTTSLSESTVYSSESALEADIVGLYSAMMDGNLYTGVMAEFLEYCSILIHWHSNKTTEEYTQALDFGWYSNYSKNEAVFNSLFKAVYRSNQLIENASKGGVDEKFQKEIEGEARLIRAILYFTLVRIYGDVPLVTRPPQSVDDANRTRDPYYLIYNQILEDLTYAEQNMRDEKRVLEVSGTTGRPHKWAATAIKATVYLQIASILESPYDQFFNSSKPERMPKFEGITSAEQAWKLALETAEDVIQHSGYELTPDYRQLFRWDVDNHPEDFQLKERIFALNSVDAVKTSNYFMCRSLPDYPEGSSNYSTKNNNAGRIGPNRYVYQRWSRTYGGKLSTGRTDLFENIYVGSEDPRFDVTYFHVSYYNLKEKKNVGLYPADGTIYKYDHPYFKKYNNPRYNVGSGYADYYYIRFAEMYLCAAEAAASLSSSKGDAYWQKALGYIEDLHKRARKSVDPGQPEAAYPTWKNMTFVDKNELIVAIFWERAYEMSCEGHEFFDVRRRGANFLIENVSKPVNAFLQEPEQDGQNAKRPDSSPSTGRKHTSAYWQYNWNGKLLSTDVEQVRKGLLCAYPQAEFRYNTSLTSDDQNEYFVK